MRFIESDKSTYALCAALLLWALPGVESTAASPRANNPPAPVEQPDHLSDVLLWDQPSERIWAWLRSSGTKGTERVRGLIELCEREDPALPHFLVEQFQQEPSGLWREGLIFALELTLVPDVVLRERLAVLLYQQALTLRDGPGPEARALWSALRRYATMVPKDQVGDFLAFLRDEDAHFNRQAALQSIRTVFSLEPPLDGLELAHVRRRVHGIALDACNAERAGDRKSLVISAFGAAVALCDPNIGELEQQLVALASPPLLWLTLGEVNELVEGWRQHAAGQTAALAYLAERQRQLRDALACYQLPGNRGGV